MSINGEMENLVSQLAQPQPEMSPNHDNASDTEPNREDKHGEEKSGEEDSADEEEYTPRIIAMPQA